MTNNPSLIERIAEERNDKHLKIIKIAVALGYKVKKPYYWGALKFLEKNLQINLYNG